MTKPKINPVVWNTFRTLIIWSPLWFVSTVVFGAIGVSYALFLKSDIWLASQSIVVREDANRALLRPERVDGEAETKAAQETFVELSKNHLVVQNALASIGPQSTFLGFEGNWPSPKDIQDTIDSVISVHAPRGIDFGKTDVIYLDVKQSSPDRAIQLNKALCTALQIHMRELRTNLATTIADELTRTRDAARMELNKANEKLQQIEQATGSDLSDLRGLIERGGSYSSRILHDQLVGEIRQAELNHHQLESDLIQLEQASKEPAAFLTAPSSLFVSQPGLIRLREGLVDSQINLATLSGRLTDDHPTMVAARRSMEDIVVRLNAEFQAALSSATRSFQISLDRVKSLQEQKASLETRLNELAEKRSTYESLLADVNTRTKIVQDAEKQLSDAEANLAVCENSSCFTLLDGPVISDRPIGPGRNTIIVASVAAGLLFGVGLVFLIAPVDVGQKYGRRAIDALGSSQVPIAIVQPSAPVLQPAAQKASCTASELIALAEKSVNAGAPAGASNVSSFANFEAKESMDSVRRSTLSPMNPPDFKNELPFEVAEKFEDCESKENCDHGLDFDEFRSADIGATESISDSLLPANRDSQVAPKTESIYELDLTMLDPIADFEKITPQVGDVDTIAFEPIPLVQDLEQESDPEWKPSQPSERRQRPRKPAASPIPTLNFGIRPTDTPNSHS